MARWTTADIPDQADRVAVVTGSNTGLGFETAKALAARGARVVLAVRNLDKGKEAAVAITAATPGADVTLQELDLGSLASVRAAAEELRNTYDHIDLLINNAGLMYPPKGNTADGFELQFGTNHLGHFAFTGLLIDRLTPVPGSRVVTLSSVGHRINAAIHFDDLQWERSYNRVAAYGQSKLSNLLFTYELQRRLSGAGGPPGYGGGGSDSGDGRAKDSPTIAVAAHPGFSNTELSRHLPGSSLPGVRAMAGLVSNSAALGALCTLRAATDPDVQGGQYFGPRGAFEVLGYPKLVESSPQSHDVDLQRRLWTVSEELTGVVYPLGDTRTR